MDARIDVELYYNKYGPMVFRRCMQLLRAEDDALDAMQDVFVNLLKQSKRLKGDYPSSLLYTMATNTCLNRFYTRKRQRENLVSEEQVEAVFLDNGYEKVNARLLIEDIFRTESEVSRVICFMHHVDGMTLEEIGNTVGLSISGVRKRLIKFNKRAQAHLSKR